LKIIFRSGFENSADSGNILGSKKNVDGFQSLRDAVWSCVAQTILMQVESILKLLKLEVFWSDGKFPELCNSCNQKDDVRFRQLLNYMLNLQIQTL